MLMCFEMKSTLKSNRYYIFKQSHITLGCLEEKHEKCIY